MKRIILAIAIAGVLAGCSPKIEVESDTSWTGNVGDRSVDGSGNSTFTVHHGDCAVFQKATADGVLRARAKSTFGSSDWTETTAAYGVVDVCAK